MLNYLVLLLIAILLGRNTLKIYVQFYTISRAFVSGLGCQHFISDWLGKLKPNKLSTGCQNELKGAAVEKATNLGRRFLFFSRLRRSFSRASRANFSWLRRSCARLDKSAMLRRLVSNSRHACTVTNAEKSKKAVSLPRVMSSPQQ